MLLTNMASRTMPQVMVISSEGFFYSYNIDLENGGECALMKQYKSASNSYSFPVHDVLMLPCQFIGLH